MRGFAVVAAASFLALASPAVAGAKTIRLFSKEVASRVYDTNGNPAQGQPQAGYTFTGTDADYRGTRKHHSKRVVAWDHISCLLVDPTTFTARCDGVIVFADGAIVVEQQTATFTQPRSVFKITGAFGAYRRAKGGTLTSINGSESSNNSELVIRY
jgi:hypothetical protein